MSIYLIPIETAILLFPILAALITIPYIFMQYHRYGSITPLRVFIVYSFIFYLLCAYFLVILPLPPIDEVAKYTTPTMQLIPFQCIHDLLHSSGFVLDNPATYRKTIMNPNFFTILFNVFLTIPFGIYLRYYFSCSWKKTLLLSFALTASFECLQLSALFGIYPRPYRLFDVDDLITNTLGGMFGYAITPIFAHFLPSKKALDLASFEKGEQVSWLRRCAAFLFDLFIITLCCAITVYIIICTTSLTISDLPYMLLASYTFYVVFLIIIVSMITKGKTLGKAFVTIRLVKQDEATPAWYHHILHYGVLYFLILPCPYLLFLVITQYFMLDSYVSFAIVLIPVLSLFYIFSIVQLIQSIFHKNRFTWYDKRAGLHAISTITNTYSISQTQKEDMDYHGYDG